MRALSVLSAMLGTSCRVSAPLVARPHFQHLHLLQLPTQRHFATSSIADISIAPPSTTANTKLVKKRKRSARRKKKPPPPFPPTPVLPGAISADLSIWENAVLLVDKPKGWTSFDVCGKLRGALAALLSRRGKHVKIGHAGTLDPMATGLLIVCVGGATKSIDRFVGMQKEYSGVFRLGEATPSFDAESDVSEQLPWEHVTDADLLRSRTKFMGIIFQVPPMFSAIRIGGKRLYDVARAGKEVERAPRAVTVDQFDLERDAEDIQNVRFNVTCSKGTYIRSLAHDLGRTVGSAAHLTALRREAIGDLRVGPQAWEIRELITAIEYQIAQQRASAAATAELADGVELPLQLVEEELEPQKA